MAEDETGTPKRSLGGRALGLLQGMAIDTSPLRESRDFRLLLTGQAINLIGSQIRMVTVPYLIYIETHSTLMVGLLGLAQFGPAFVCSLIGGTLADSMDRRKLLLVTQAMLMLTSGALAAATIMTAGRPPTWYIFVLLMIAAGIGAVDAPARRAAVIRMIGKEHLSAGLALNQIVGQTGSVIGPAIAGVLIALIGVGPSLLIDTATFGASLGALVLIGPMPLADALPKRSIAAIFEGFAFLKDKPVIKLTFLIDLNATFFGRPNSLFPALAENVFRVGPGGLGLMYAMPGVGATIAALCSGWVGGVRRQGRAVVIAVVIWGLAMASFGLLAHAFWLALVFLAIAFAADQYSAIFRGTILQVAVPDRLRGRLSSIHFLVVSSGPQLGNFEAGAVGAVAGTEMSVVSGGIISAIGAALVGLTLPVFWRYDAVRDAVPDEDVAPSAAAASEEETPAAGVADGEAAVANGSAGGEAREPVSRVS